MTKTIKIGFLLLLLCININIYAQSSAQEPYKNIISILNYLLLDDSQSDYVRIRPPLGLHVETVQIPLDNKLTQSKVELGKILFFDKRMSFDDSVSCASCHKPDHAFSDNVARSAGINGALSKRNTPPIFNLVFRGFTRSDGTIFANFFWDGRTPSLEQQAVEPIINPDELGMPSFEALVTKLNQIEGYKPLFENAFGTPDVTIARIGKAIASFERTLTSGNAPLDRYVYLNDENALSASAKRGMENFFVGHCHFCHSFRSNSLETDVVDTGLIGGDLSFESIGVGADAMPPDLGNGQGKFRAPSLRNLAFTAPYMHDGSLETLEDVIQFYSDIDINELPDSEQHLIFTPGVLQTEQNKQDMIEFLESMNGEIPVIEEPTVFPQ